jgi:hypothetical protein
MNIELPRGPKWRRRPSAGMSLAMVLCVLPIAVVMVMMLVSGAFCETTLVDRMSSVCQAHNLAQSMTACAIAQVMASNGTFGRLRCEVIQAQPTWGDGKTRGVVSFSTVTPNWSTSLPFSTNNLAHDTNAPGWGRKVPPNTIDIIGTATCHGINASAETLVYVPPYPYAISASGPVHSDTGVTVAAVNDPKNLQSSISAIDPSALRPSALVSNSLDVGPSPAVVLEQPSKVMGDVQACGSILVPANAVQGQSLPFSPPLPLPNVVIQNYEPQDSQVDTFLLPTEQGRALEGWSKGKQNVEVFGNLTLNSAGIYVDGDLTVHGALLGKGAVFATGSIALEAGESPTDLTSDNQVAIAAQKNVTLTATSKDNNFFRGLVYTEGNFVADKITIMGAFVGNGGKTGSSGASSAMTLNTDIVQVPQYTHLDINIITSSTTTTPGASAGVINTPNGQFHVGWDPANGAWGVEDQEFTNPLDAIHYLQQASGDSNIDFASAITVNVFWFLPITLPVADIPFLSQAFPGATNQELQALFWMGVMAFYTDLGLMPRFHLSSTHTSSSSTTKTTTSQQEFLFDLNQFLQLADTMRVLYSRDFTPSLP